MNDIDGRRLAFLERELDRMGCTADHAEEELRLNPTDAAARRRLEAIYALAAEIWQQIQALRAHQSGRHAVIYYDRDADTPAARTHRQALV